MRVVHLITGLQVGGAESMLAKLLAASPAREGVHVVSLTGDGPIGERIRALGVETTFLGLRRGIPSPSLITRCAGVLRRQRPAVLQTWMYHADLAGGLAAALVGGIKVVWGIRNSTLDPATSKWSTRSVRRACALLSARLPDAIVSCSKVAADHHVSIGYAADRMQVIPNGFDLRRFAPSAEARAAVRAELSIPASAPVVGIAARFDPQKDHATFLRAAERIHRRRADAVFVMCGDGVDPSNGELARLVDAGGLSASVRLLGRRDDLHRVVASWDVAALSSSSGEAFPNTLGEAMASGVPCVTTEVGDSAIIVGDTGRVVAPRDDAAFADAVLALFALPAPEHAALGARARARVQSEFDIGRVAERYRALYSRLASGGPASPEG